MSGRITILGCGSSGGVPRVGQGWGACDPAEPKNARLRCSILIERRAENGGTTTVLVDTSPDLRQQLLRAGTSHLDAIVLTHPHADHTHGIDDVRALVLHMKRRIDIFMDKATARDMRAKFAYIFETPSGSLYHPLLDARPLDAGTPLRVDGAGGALDITAFDLEHGEITALGLRVGGLAYTPDLNRIPKEAEPYLHGLDTWIIDALRYRSHPSHFSLSEALAAVERFAPRHAVVTNLHNDLDYGTLQRELPAGVLPAYDGMVVTFDPSSTSSSSDAKSS